MPGFKLRTALRPDASPGLRLRLALLTLVRELCPGCGNATLLLEHKDGEVTGVVLQNPGRNPRWPGHPRLEQARDQLGRLVHDLYPECQRATCLCQTAGITLGLLDVPIF